MKKLLSVLLALTVLIGACGIMSVSAAPAYFSLTVGDTELDPGQTVTVSLIGSGLSAVEGAQLYIYYDPTVFEVVKLAGEEYVGRNVLPGGWDGSMAMSKIPGRLLYMMYRDSSTNALPEIETRMHNLNLRVKADAPTCTTGISMSLVKVVNSDAQDVEAGLAGKVEVSVVNPDKPVELPEPGVVDGTQVLEAEEAEVIGARIRNKGSDQEGRFVGNIGNNGGTVTFTVDAAVAGTRQMKIVYNSADDRSYDITLNYGGDALRVNCPGNGKGNWDSIFDTVTVSVDLKEGINTITFDRLDGPAPNLDCIELDILREMNSVEKAVYLIENLGEITELAQKGKVDEARAAYDALTDEEKAQVGEEMLKVLTDAETVIAGLIGDVDTTAVEEVIATIDALGEITELAQEADVVAARSAYDELTDEQKLLVTNYGTLTAAEKAINDLKAALIIPGDVDQSGTVDVADIMKLKALIMADTWSDEELTIGDLDESGRLDVGDIMAVKNIIMSK